MIALTRLASHTYNPTSCAACFKRDAACCLAALERGKRATCSMKGCFPSLQAIPEGQRLISTSKAFDLVTPCGAMAEG